ncbi:SCP2 sterol-binding domain-containing protein [Nocardioides sp. LS1]|uniref:SCP2 sterol-binding domain-containing protein n=1 Tax=Nocardioides sp. LS1 TaxID=1027620 RepID=UPI000F61AD74|nr:SCP2 sterol-binding domain-containing protein [Nocardioides sp. LS1]GCD89361.1 hypothetical protein NLS1_13670 [Nocardioides sp. LS1]
MTQVHLDLGHLRTDGLEEATAFFATVDPEALVDAIRATSDDELLELLARDDIRPAAVRGLLARLHEYAVAERLAELRGTVRFDLERRGTLLERQALRFDAGAMTLVPDLDARTPVDVVISTSLVRFVRLVSGERNAGLEYLSGKLDIEGDAMLALAVGGIFKLPGTGEIALDPTTLDPVDVATALADVRPDHLKRVMASAFRPIVLGEIFRRLPDFLNARKAAKADLTIGFRLLGNPSGEVERYVVRVQGGVATVSQGDEGERRDATVTCEGHDYLRLATGHLNPVTGVLKGQLKVKGDKAKALQLSSIIDIPRAR